MTDSTSSRYFPRFISRRSLLQTAAAGWLAGVVGCRVGPEYARPCVDMKSDWTLSDNSHLQGEYVDPHRWWLQFQDPVLTQAIEQMRRENLTLREAGCRIIESRARLKGARGNLFPQFQSLDGAYAKSRLSQNTANFFTAPGIFQPDLEPESWTTGFNASWELDFWGRYRRAIESADATLESTVADYHDVMVLLLAEVAVNYVQMRTYERRYELARRNLEVQRRTLELTKQKKDAGLASAVDVAQAESNFGQTGSLLPSLEILRRQASHRLCVLLGQPPEDLATIWGTTATIPRPLENVAVDIPANLIRRRPDVRRAERQLAAQCARVGIATTEFYPHLSLNGNIGVSSEKLSNLFESGSFVGLISPQFHWNILNYGRIRANLEAEKAVFCQLENAYRQAVLDALQEAEDAQVAFAYSFDRAEWLSVAVRGAELAVEKTEVSYREGTVDFARVYILQGELLRQQDQLAIAESEIALGMIAIFKAAGGGWDVRNEADGSVIVTESDVPLASDVEEVEANEPVESIPEPENVVPTKEAMPPVEPPAIPEDITSAWAPSMLR